MITTALPGSTLRDSFLVYEFIKDGRTIYVGRSSKGLFRIFNSSVKHTKLREIADELRLHWCDSDAEMCDLELTMIVDLKPEFNELSKPGFSPLSSTTFLANKERRSQSIR